MMCAESQQPLFGAEKPGKSLYVCVARKSALFVLSGGILGPGGCYINPRPEKDILGLCAARLPLGSAALAVALNTSLSDDSETRFPVLIEVDTSAAGLLQEAAEVTGEPAAAGDGQAEGAGYLSGSLPVSMIRCLHFRSDEELSDFRARAFANVPTEFVRTEVSPELFEPEDALQAVAAEIISSAGSSNSDEQAAKVRLIARSADRWAGGLAMLLQCAPPAAAWHQAIEELAESAYVADGSNAAAAVPGGAQWLVSQAGLITAGDNNCAQGTDVESELFRRALAYLQETSVADGWTAVDVLGKVSDPGGHSAEAVETIEKWNDNCRKILANKIKAGPERFSDEKSVVQRALLLFLMRPDPEDILNSSESSLRPGPVVRALSAFLAGARVGFDGLPNKMKGDAECYQAISLLKSAVYNRMSPVGSAEVHAAPINVQQQSRGPAGRSHDIFVGDFRLFSGHIEPPRSLRVVRDTAEYIDLRCDYDDAHSQLMIDLSHTRYAEDGVTEVYVTDTSPDQDGGYVRFWVKCADLSKAAQRRKLTKGKFEELMQRHADPAFHCRYAIDNNAEALIALVDQWSDTLDSKELEKHIESLSKATAVL